MNMKTFFENIVSFFKNIEVSDIIAKTRRYANKAKLSVTRFIFTSRKYAYAVARFFFAEETISDIKKVGAFVKKISKTVARIAAIPCFIIGLSMVFSGLTSSLATVILGIFIMALPKAILESGKKKEYVFVKTDNIKEYDSSSTPAFASVTDIDDSEK